MSSLTDSITGAITLPLKGMGLAVVRVCLVSKKTVALQVMIDSLEDGKGVTLETCEGASHLISALLDNSNPISGKYTLEVSTPGIDRPLFCAQDWKRHVGHVARVALKTPWRGNRRNFRGEIVGAEGDNISLKVDVGTIQISLQEVRSARLVLTEKLLRQASKKARTESPRLDWAFCRKNRKIKGREHERQSWSK